MLKYILNTDNTLVSEPAGATMLFTAIYDDILALYNQVDFVRLCWQI